MLLDNRSEERVLQARGDGNIGLAPLLAVSIAIVFVVAGSAFASGDEFVASIRTLSPKLRSIEFDYWSFGVGIIGLVSVIAGIAVTFCRSAKVFWILVLLGFGLSEALIPAVSYVSLAIRYASMAVLAAAALLSFTATDVRLGATQVFGLLLFGWMLVRVVIGGAAQHSLMLIPIYTTILAGVLLGMREKSRTKDDVLLFNKVLAGMGVIFTLVHLSAFLFAAAPYEAGRFKSYYVLPTNFANAYVLMVVAMLWQAVYQKQKAMKTFFWTVVCVGGTMLVLSGTRNAVLVLGVSWVLFSTISLRRALYRAVVLVVAIVGLFAVADRKMHSDAEVVDRLARISVANRTDVWRLAWEQIKSNPYLGYGLGSTSGVLESKVEKWEQATYINAHNEYLGIWLQLGIAGLVLLVAMYVSALWRGAEILNGRSYSADERGALILPIVFSLSLALAGLFEENLSSRGSLQQIVWSTSLMILSQYRRRSEPVAKQQLSNGVRFSIVGRT